MENSKKVYPEAYGDTTGTIRVLEKRLISSAEVDRIIEAGSVEEAIALISQNSSITNIDNESVSNQNDLDTILGAELEECYEYIKSISPEAEVVEIPRLRYVYHNMKVRTKNEYAKYKLPEMPIGETNIDYGIEETKISDPQLIDLHYDKLLHEKTMEMALKYNNEFITNYYRVSIDFYNIKIMLRGKLLNKPVSFLYNYFVDEGNIDKSKFVEIYDKSITAIKETLFYTYLGDVMKKGLEYFETNNKLALLEKYMDNYLLDLVKQSRYVAFGPELLFSYLLSKENEISQIRLLLSCKLNNISDEIIKERLRNCYA